MAKIGSRAPGAPRARGRPGAGGPPGAPPGGPPGTPREGGFRPPWTPLRLGEFLCPWDQVSRTIRIAETCEETGDKETRSIATSDCRSLRETLKEGEPEGRREQTRPRNDSDSVCGQDTQEADAIAGIRRVSACRGRRPKGGRRWSLRNRS